MVAYTSGIWRYLAASAAPYQSPDDRWHRATANALTQRTASSDAAILLQGQTRGQ